MPSRSEIEDFDALEPLVSPCGVRRARPNKRYVDAVIVSQSVCVLEHDPDPSRKAEIMKKKADLQLPTARSAGRWPASSSAHCR
jgi:hypothetical protein